jgi:hypothetical protein
MKTPLTKVEMIERSMSCFQWGLLSLLPVIGILMAVPALRHYYSVKSSQAGGWNPAQRRLRWGIICARLGIAGFLLIVLIVTLCVVSNYLHNAP